MANADPKPSTPEPAKIPTVDERLKELREVASTADEAGFRAAFQEASKLEMPRVAEARAKKSERLITQSDYRERLEKLKKRTAQGKALTDVTKKAHTSDPETAAIVDMKKKGNTLFGSTLPTYLKRVADRRGIDLEAPGARDTLLADIVKGAARPLDQGYDPNVPIYDPKKKAFDTDAMQVANIWSMSALGKKYTNPQLLREGLPEDLQGLVREQQNLQTLFDQEAAEGRTERFVGVLEGADEPFVVNRTADENLNTQIARKQPHSVEHTLLLANIDEDTKRLLREAATTEPTKESMDAAGLLPSEQRKIVSLHRMRGSARPQDIRLAIDRTADGSYVVDLGKHFLDIYRSRFAAIGQQKPEMSFEDKQDQARREANEAIQRMVNIRSPVYHPDPEGAFRDYLRGEGALGTWVSGANTLASVASLGLDEVTGDFVDKMQRSSMAVLLPPVRVAGTLKEATGEEVQAGEFGTVSRYVSDGWATRGIDQLLRLTPISEPLSAAYAMALEEVVEEEGTFSGKIFDIGRRVMEIYGTDEHLFRVASRDDDMSTMMFTLGRALDPTVALGLRDEPDEPGVLDYMTTIGGALAMTAAMVFEPDALTLISPAAGVAATAARAATLASKLDGVATVGRGITANATYKGLKGRAAIEGLLDDVVAGVATEADYIKTVDDWARADPLGRGAVGVRASEMENLNKLGIEATTPGQVPSISRDVLRTNDEMRQAYDAEVARLDGAIKGVEKKIKKSKSPRVAEARVLVEEVRKRADATAAETKQRESLDYASLQVQELEQRLIDLGSLPTTGPKVDDAVRKGLADELKALDLTDDAALIHFLQKNSTQKVMRAGGLDPVEMLARAQALKQTGEARGISRPAKMKQFAEDMRKSVLGTLNRPMADAIAVTTKRLTDELAAARKRQALDAKALKSVQKRLKKLNKSIDKRLQSFDLTARGKKDLQAGKLRDLDMSVRQLRKFLQRADAGAVNYAKKSARYTESRRQALASGAQRKAAAKEYMAGTLRSLLQLSDVSEGMGRAAGRIRDKFSSELGVLEATASKGDKGKVLNPQAVKRAESVLREAVPVRKLLDDMKAKLSPEDYEVAVERLLKNQIFVQQAYRTPGAVGDLMRAQPNARAVHTFIETQGYKAARLLAKAQGWWDQASRSFSVEMGVLDIKANKELQRAAAESRMYARSISGELNEYIKHGPKIAGEAPADQIERMFIEFMSGTEPITVRTGLPYRQDIQLQGRVMSAASPLDNAVDYLVDAARLYAKGGEDADEALVALVRSFAKDRLSRQVIDKFETLALRSFSDELLALVKAQTSTTDIVKQMPDIIRKAWGRGAAAAFEKSTRNYEMFAKTMTIIAAEGYLLKKVVGTVGAKNFLFSPMRARAINNFLDEGLFVAQGVKESIATGDIVVSRKAVRKFNRVINKPIIRVDPAAVRVADTEVAADRVSRGIEGLPVDPRVPGKAKITQDNLEETIRGTAVGTKRDVFAEQNARGFSLKSYRVSKVYTQKVKKKQADGSIVEIDVQMVRLTDMAGKYVGTRPMKEMTFRDPVMGFNDAIDGVLALGLSFTSGRSKNAIEASGAETKRQYSRLVARSLDADGNVLYVPRDLSRELYDALEGLQKDLVDAPAMATVSSRALALAGKAVGFYKRAILFGLVIPRASFAPNASFGDTTQMIIDLNDVPLRDVLRVSAYGALGYVPFAGKALQNGYGVLRKGRQLPTPTSVLSDPATKAVLAGTDDLIEIRRNGKVVGKEKAIDILRKAYQQGAGDNILSSDEMLALRKLQGKAIFEDYGRGMELHIRESTRAQRVGLFLNLYAEQGMTAEKAGLRMRQSLFNWDDAVGRSELRFLGRNFLFYTFTKNAMAQAHRALFEGYNDGLDVALRKFGSGQTKLQRLEFLSRLSAGFIDRALAPDEMTAEEAAAEAQAQEMPEYSLEATILQVDPVPKKFQKYSGALYGRKIDSIAGMLPKITHIEFLSNYIEFFNATAVPATVGALNVLGVTDYEPDFAAAGESLTRFVEDMANPFSGEVIRAIAESLGVKDPQSGRSDAGPRVRMYEAVMLTHFGLGDGLELQEDDTLRIHPDSTSNIVTKLLGGTTIALERQFLLPEYTRFRLLDELNGGYVTEGSIGLFQALARNMPGVDPYSEVDMARIRAAPVSVEYTRAQKGWIAARIKALSEYLGFYRAAVFSGKETQEFRLKDADQEMSSIISQARKRGRPTPPIPELPGPGE
jgi:hypothetical protein